MRKSLPLLVLWLTMCVTAFAQSIPARTNVIPYYDDDAIEKGAYRESPYFMELTGSWQQRVTDSSLRYSKQLEAERNWADYLVYLNVRCGKAVRVLLDDKEVGYADDSRQWNEFLLSPLLKVGRTNVLTIEALRNPREAVLEDVALPVGLNGEPYLVFKTDPNIVDYTLVADYDAVTTTGTLTIGANVFCGKRKGKHYVEVEVWDPKGHNFDRMGRWVVFNGKNEESVDISRSWSGVASWTAETPNLYTAVIRLRDEKMEEVETIGTRFGFRSVEVKDGVMLLNGKPITIKGVTYGLEHTEGYSSREQMRRDIETMKRHNINAVRTSRYSPMEPYFYELCDRYGLYVVCDANLMPLSEQRQAVATDPDLVPLFEHRVENLYGTYKNHTSIIAWSLGNTRDNAVCMTAAFKRLKAIEKTRPVIFSGAGYGESTDVIAPIMADVDVLKQMLKKPNNRPMLLLASVDAFRFANLQSLWQLVTTNRQLQGGFVNAWPLSATMLSELKHLYSPLNVTLSKMTPDDGEFVVYNNNDFSSFSQYTLEYNIFTNLRPSITGGDLPVAVPCGGSDKVSMRIPHVDLQAGEELFIRFNLTTRRDAMQPWQGGGDLVRGTVEMPLSQMPPSARFFVNEGEPLGDSLVELHRELYFVGHEDWTVAQADRQVRRPNPNTLCVDYMLRYSAADGATMCDVRNTYTLFSTGDVVVDYTIAPTDRIPGGALQPALRLKYDADSVSWYGLDREVCFEQQNSGLIGIYTRDAKGLKRREVRWCALRKGGEDLFVELLGQRFSMSTDGKVLGIIPAKGGDLRLHMKPYRGQNPATLTGVAFPRTTVGMLQPPTITASEARFSQPLTVTLSTPQSCEIRYTLDGTEPSEASERYTAPITIATTTVVKARAFAKDTPPSFTTTRKFNYDYIVKTSFSRRASTPYNAGADTVLYDGEKGTVDDLARGWIGFAGDAVVTTVQLAKPIDVETVTLRYAHTPASWAFAPRSVALALSADGINYGDTITIPVTFDPTDETEATPWVVELKATIGRSGIGCIKIIPQTIGTIPAWHRAKGLKPWLLMDEIEIIER